MHYPSKNKKFVSYNIDCPQFLNTKKELTKLYNSNPYKFRNCEINKIEPIVYQSELIEYAWSEKSIKDKFLKTIETEHKKGYGVFPHDIISFIDEIPANYLNYCNVEFEESMKLKDVDIFEDL